MACEEHELLFKALVEAMVAEDRTRDSGSYISRSMSVSKRLDAQQSAHSKVVLAEMVVNRHIDECPACQADGQNHHNATVGQF
jgi:hypothetical protein